MTTDEIKKTILAECELSECYQPKRSKMWHYHLEKAVGVLAYIAGGGLSHNAGSIMKERDACRAVLDAVKKSKWLALHITPDVALEIQQRHEILNARLPKQGRGAGGNYYYHRHFFDELSLMIGLARFDEKAYSGHTFTLSAFENIAGVVYQKVIGKTGSDWAEQVLNRAGVRFRKAIVSRISGRSISFMLLDPAGNTPPSPSDK